MHGVLTIFETGPNKSNSQSKAGRAQMQTKSNTKPMTQNKHGSAQRPLQSEGWRSGSGFWVKKEGIPLTCDIVIETRGIKQDS